MKKFNKYLLRKTKCKKTHLNLSPEQYGVLKGNFCDIDLNFVKSAYNAKFPHYNLLVNVNGVTYVININIMSRDKKNTNLKVFYSETPETDLINSQVFKTFLTKPIGTYKNLSEDLSLDYLRGNYFDLTKLEIPVQSGVSDEKKILFDIINKHMVLAQKNKYDFVVWGNFYDNGFSRFRKSRYGMHDVHMNQGSTNGSKNAIWKDGAFMICDEQSIKFICFLTFSTQCLSTDNEGNCKTEN